MPRYIVRLCCHAESAALPFGRPHIAAAALGRRTLGAQFGVHPGSIPLPAAADAVPDSRSAISCSARATDGGALRDSACVLCSALAPHPLQSLFQSPPESFSR